ncbi:MAG TPA: isochorismatase family protein [Polyangiaceae bacterium]|nr:isochorismatase family protein [Polyangiaceae bacterium]
MLERLMPSETAVLVVDVQERLSTAMPRTRMADLVRAARILIEGGQALGAHVFATEQYPRGLGRTLEAVAGLLDRASAPRFEKLGFSAWSSEPLRAALEQVQPRSVVVLGMEAHVCVFQSVRDLARAGYAVYVPVDGVVSRRDDQREVGLQLCERSGAVLSSAESVAFDWLEQAGTPAFKLVSGLIR